MAHASAAPALHQSTLVSLGHVRMAASELRARSGPGERIFITSLSGWDDRPREQTDAIPHWSGDGEVAGVERSGSRIVQLRGYVKGTPTQVAEARDELASAGGVLVVDERNRLLAREASVRVTSLTWDGTSPNFDRFAATVVADDPLRYSSDEIALRNGSIVLVIRGTRSAMPMLDLIGPHAAISIAHAGGTWTLSATPSGASRLVDLRNGDVWQAGVRIFAAESGAPPVVPPGESSWTVSGIGAGTARARRFEAWL